MCILDKDVIEFKEKCMFVSEVLSNITKINIKSGISHINIFTYMVECYIYCKEFNKIRFYINVLKGKEDVISLHKIAKKFNLELIEECSYSSDIDYSFYARFNELDELYILCKLIKG